MSVVALTTIDSRFHTYGAVMFNPSIVNGMSTIAIRGVHVLKHYPPTLGTMFNPIDSQWSEHDCTNISMLPNSSTCSPRLLPPWLVLRYFQKGAPCAWRGSPRLLFSNINKSRSEACKVDFSSGFLIKLAGSHAGSDGIVFDEWK